LDFCTEKGLSKLKKLEIVRWGIDFNWNKSLKKNKKNGFDKIILFIHEKARIKGLNFSPHLKLHEKFPYSIVQGNFSFLFPNEKMELFKNVSDGILCQIPLPFNLSIPYELLKHIGNLDSCKSFADFVLALKSLSEFQLAPIYFASHPEIIYVFESPDKLPIPWLKKNNFQNLKHSCQNSSIYKITYCEEIESTFQWMRSGGEKETDEIWVPVSNFRKLLLQKGCRIPIFVMDWSIDTLIFKPSPFTRHRFPGKFSILVIHDESDSLWTDILIQAYHEEFKNGEPVLLNLIQKEFSVLKSLKPNIKQTQNPPQCFFWSCCDQNTFASLLNSSDIVINTREDGFYSRKFFEAMACAKPGAGVYNEEISNLLNGNFSYLIKADPQKPDFLNSVKSFLRWVYEHPAELREKGMKSREYVLMNLIQSSSKRAAERLQQIQKEKIGSRIKLNVLEHEPIPFFFK
jgi:hypothetical protein